MSNTATEHQHHTHEHGDHHSLRLIPLVVCILIGLAGWFCPAPEGISTQGWHILDIFVVTILALIIKPLPMGAVAMIASWTAPPAAINGWRRVPGTPFSIHPLN